MAHFGSVRDYWERPQDGVSVSIAHVIKTCAFICKIAAKRTASNGDLVDLSWRETFWLVLGIENVCGVKMTMSK